MANQFLALSLFLMLLSFFIVMNAISSFEESKVNPRMNSISLAFSMNQEKEDQMPSHVETPRVGSGSGDTFEDLNGLFESHIAGFQMTKNRLGTQMYVKMPVAEFQQALKVPLTEINQQGEERGFLPTLISMLRADKKGLPYRMDMLLNIPSDVTEYKIQNPEGFDTALKNVAGFALKLENDGLPKYLLSAGLKKGEPQFIELVFMKHEPYNALESVAPEDKRE